MSTEVQVPEYLRKYMANNEVPNDADSMSSASVSVPRVSLKGKRFQLINGDEESKKSDKLHIVILAVEPEGSRMVKTYYAGGYNPNDTAPPDCSSSDGIAPDAWVQSPQSRQCQSCPKNVFGSATNAGTGKKTKACRDAKRLWVAKPDDVQGTVFGLNVPVTSLKNMADYGRSIRSMGVPLSAVITELEMDEDSEFPLLHFKRLGFLNEEVGTQALERNMAKDWLTRPAAGPALPNASADQKQLADRASDPPFDVDKKSVSSEDIDKAAENW